MKNDNMKSPLIVSVVRDLDMYGRCISDNSHLAHCCLRMIDNRVQNMRIPVLYNQVLDSMDKTDSRWLVFCHEDFMPLESVVECLEKADTQKIYGVLGGVLKNSKRWLLGGIWYSEDRGQIIESNKDGTGAFLHGVKVPINTPVETVDCQCVIVHSSLVQAYGLRFDEHLSFDLYAEDFSIGAFIQYGIVTAILPLKCQHFSKGKLQPRFYEQKAYLDNKYPKFEAFGCVGYTIGGGRTPIRRFQKRIRSILDARAPWAVNLIFKMMPKT